MTDHQGHVQERGDDGRTISYIGNCTCGYQTQGITWTTCADRLLQHIDHQHGDDT